MTSSSKKLLVLLRIRITLTFLALLSGALIVIGVVPFFNKLFTGEEQGKLNIAQILTGAGI